ncbi:thiol reductant ABC exporter subunit CydD [Salimicrobium flavidum]|uniref:ATP-binding cassette, subfamily C, CydD n=1 Tax=Salimicrobium flavidum TaxID=570947 RepID=A0A1N7K9F5_9BACI|nr:thiol reductant ABC exporter subunit CydD [Salimicrobium flavidum]SIS58209.1 ATP-binding cassette, subfamily C, CydD [Salimicrobium flavidum]
MKEWNLILKQEWKKVTVMAVAALVLAASIIMQGYLFVSIVDDVFINGAGLSAVMAPLFYLLAVLWLRTGVSTVISRAGVRLASRAKREMRYRLLHKIASGSTRDAAQTEAGRRVSIFMDSIEETDSYFSGYVPQVIQSLIVPFFLFVTIALTHLNSALIILATSPFIPLFYIIIGLKTKEKSEEKVGELNALSGKFLDILQGLTTLKLFLKANDQKETIRSSSLRFREATMEVLKTAFVSSLMLELISMLSIGLIALEIALQLIIFENMNFFTAFFILILAPEFYNFLKQLGFAFHTGRTSMGAAAKVYEEINKPEDEVMWGEEKLVLSRPPHIILRQATYSYEEDGFELGPVTVDLSPGKSLAIAGRTGSGKSTLLHILSGLLPISREMIEVEGRSLYSYQEKEWMNHISYISQHPYIFSGTLRENVVIGAHGDPSEKEVSEAIQKAGLHELVQKLDSGMETSVGEGGRGLSGGEKQRLALARAFLKNPYVILLDEPTTGLDLETERILGESLEELSEQATMITVAHRLHTIREADEILFLENGRVAGQGSHEELLRDVDEYRRMTTVSQGGEAQ